MSDRWPGGIVRATPVAPTGPFQAGTAPGVWTMEQAAYWTKQGLWPTAGNTITQLMATLATGNFGGGYNLALDTSGNAYLIGATNISGSNSVSIFKFNKSGTLLWQKGFASPSGTIDPVGFGIDGSSNVYLVATYAQAPVRTMLMKIDTDGNLVWQRLLSIPGNTTISCTGLAVDSAGNSYVGGYIQNNNTAILIKYGTNGTLVWQNITAPSSGYTITSVALDASGNIYASGLTNGTQLTTFKFNSSGTIQWVRNLNGGYASSIAVDASANVYTLGWSNTISNVGIILAKYDTNGALQWQKRLGSSNNDRSTRVCLDTSGNPYVLGYIGTGNFPYIVARYNPSGTLQWQNTLDTGGPGNGGIAIDAVGNVVVCTHAKPSGASGTNTVFFARLPADGTKTGTRTVGSTTVVYSTSAAADNTATLTASSPSTTTQSGPAADAAGSSTLSSLSITPSVVTI